ncbi:MAG: hypothetical protein HYX39_14295 [Bacteroidetes bacterium]|nr:hypothetical protein [Bacteroidota bacterium]
MAVIDYNFKKKPMNNNRNSVSVSDRLKDVCFSNMSHSNNGTIAGGFSLAYVYTNTKEMATTKNKDGCVISNNCRGANCGEGCGIKNPF